MAPDIEIEKSLVAAFIVPQKRPQAIYQTLRKMGAPRDCYVLSEQDRDDAKRMDLLEALIGSVGCGIGSVISCVPGRLAFYEEEDLRCVIS